MHIAYLYILIVSLLWAVFAFTVSRQLHPQKSVWHHILCGVINLVACPFAMLLAAVKNIRGNYVTSSVKLP